ncbi:hypothetical protein [Planctomyces sp. SH-PL62]|uniref:hypothetical protein n=1 Tax=Planctomyces sp. SH-PL62 TaxID=1636152 RepID=UPI00078DCCD0|nr:hypothetical protein [Planctomyces sp. SH-PL62]AMV37740.1 hypothetical protein VT85_09910 [Planctomyces sp. SH-PL62]
MRIGTFVLLLAAWTVGARAGDDAATFAKGLPDRPDHFPIAVWLQDVANAEKYRAIGVNVYVGLWRGPTVEQLDALDAAGIRVIAGQSPRSLAFRDRPTIVGWMHDDEPDNAQALPNGKGYGPPVTPETILERYRAMKAADPDRPVLLNLGQGVAWDGWYGRGTRTNHPEDYPEYLKGCDIASFDIYPACSTDAAVAGKLWYVPQGVDRLREWTGGRKPVWCCIETTRISNEDRKATPQEIRSEVWMALIRGAKGLIYFCHQFKPTFIEAGLLADDAVAREVAATNARIHELAPVLNSPDVPDGATVSSSDESIPIAWVVKRLGDETYLFAASLREGETTATFQLPGQADAKLAVEVLDESRTLEAPAGAWSDRFTAYQVHLYRIRPRD